ncbi:hypothetical protein [Polynucleobacter sp. AP-Titi-500A-B4]|nr:hypothetical protein [Polynucleobacter sp. AP-Titi-500A-B4]QWE12491.1 hypothetical protein FD968_10385 [Polynucleobacter sp. AP-Titi-500A-B4]
MSKFILWVRISQTQTANTVVFADSQIQAKLIGELQFGLGNVLGYTEVWE